MYYKLYTNYRKLRLQSFSTVSVWLLSAHSVVLGRIYL